MVEPTETESRETLDSFIAAMRQIADDIENDPEVVKTAPHVTIVRKLDEVLAARQPCLRWAGPPEMSGRGCWWREPEPCDPWTNMTRDAALLETLGEGKGETTVRIYQWDRPAVTVGRHQDEDAVREIFPLLPIIPRPTGGRAVLHGEDLTITVAVLESSLAGAGSGLGILAIVQANCFRRFLSPYGLWRRDDVWCRKPRKSMSELLLRPLHPVILSTACRAVRYSGARSAVSRGRSYSRCRCAWMS